MKVGGFMETTEEEKITLELTKNELVLLKQLIGLGTQYIGSIVPTGQGKIVILGSLKLEEKINNLTKIEEK